MSAKRLPTPVKMHQKPTAVMASALTSGSSTAVTVGGGAGEIPPGFYQLTLWGTPDSSTIDVEFSPDGGSTWIDTEVTAVDANQIVGFTVVAGKYRVTVNTAGGSTSWNVDLRGAE